MYPDLSYVFHDLFGTSPDNWTSIFKTFGVFLGLALVTGGYIVKQELKRKEAEGLMPKLRINTVGREKLAIQEALINGLVGFCIGFKLPAIFLDFSTFKADPTGMIFSLKGNLLGGLICLVLFAGYYYLTGIKGRTESTMEPGEYYLSPHQKTIDIMFLSGLFGIIGARLFSVLENWSDFIQDPLGQLFSGSGLTIYGGLIVAFTVVYFYIKKLGINPLHMMDVAGLAIMAGYGVGRMGCHFSGDGDWGIVNTAVKPSWFIFPDSWWAYSYPRNVLGKGKDIADCVGQYCLELTEPVYPTPIYEIILSFLIFGILWKLRKRVKIPGMLFFYFMILSGIERFFIERIRVNERYEYFNLDWSLSQWIAFFVIVGGVIGAIKFSKNKPGLSN